MSDKASKTEKPTPKRARDAVRDGNTPRTPDLTAWLTVLSFTVLAPLTVGKLRGLFDQLMQAVVDVIAHPDPVRATRVFTLAGTGVVGVLAPVLLASVAVAFAGGALQGGLRVSTKRFKPKFDKLNPLKGFKHMFGVQAAWGFGKTMLKFVAMGSVAALILKGAAAQYTDTGAWSLTAVVSTAGASSLQLVRNIAAIGLVLAALDYMVEKRRVGKSIMMSHEEIKQETRQSDGDPHQKAAVRARQREMSGNRMISSVANADVVIVNPTHVAVALVYEQGNGAPRVVAKGKGAVAARIREEAEKHDRPMVQDIPLARTIYGACEVGEQIPVELYDAVARVLAFVMAVKRGVAVGPYRAPVLAVAG